MSILKLGRWYRLVPRVTVSANPLNRLIRQAFSFNRNYIKIIFIA